MRRGFFLFCCACGACGVAMLLATRAAWAEAPASQLTASEKVFVAKVSRDLQMRFAATGAAAKAGYVRFTEEDDSGAISWVNQKYWKSDPAHPSQLWYDVKGRLIGADFSLPKSDSPTPPSLWGVAPSRWGTLGAHVHFGVKGQGGAVTFGAMGPKTLSQFGSSVGTATAEDVVRAGKAASVDQVAFVVRFPAVWDLQVWLIPNPDGAFAEKNPNVIPSEAAKK